MKDKQFWDTFLSSMEDLKEEPPSSVKEGVFQHMDRYYRRRRRSKRGVAGVIGACVLGVSGFFLIDNIGEGSKELAGNQVEIPAHALPKGPLEPYLPPSSAVGSEASKKASKQENVQQQTLASKRGPGEGQNRTLAEEQGKKGGQKENGEEVQEGKEARSGNGQAQKEILKGRGGGDEKAVLNDEKKGQRKLSGDLKKEGEERRRGDTRTEKGSEVKVEGPKEEMERMPARLPENGPIDPAKADLAAVGSLPEKDMTSFDAPRFFIGSDLTFNFTRLMDTRTLESFEATSLVSTKGDLYYDHSITAGVRVSPRTKVLGRYFMKKDVGQRYDHYVNGRYRSEGIQLSYRNFELLAEHDLAQGYLKAKHRTYFSIYGGINYAHLRNAERKEEGRTRTVTDRYKDSSIGVDGGFRMGVETKPGLDLGVLLGVSYSLTSIRKNDADDMLMKNNARNLTLGGGLSLRYYFGSGL